MPKTHPPYPAEFRQQIIELVRAGRTPAELSREFQVTAQTIQNWVGQAARDAGQPLPGKEGLSTAEREELARLRRQVKQLQTERDILAKATAWFAGKKRCDTHIVFELVMANQAVYPVRTFAVSLAYQPAGSMPGVIGPSVGYLVVGF